MMRSYNYIVMILVICAGFVCAGFFEGPVLAAEDDSTVVYNLNEEPQFVDRTRDDVVEMYSDCRYAGPSYESSDQNSYYVTKPSLKSPYAIGELTPDTLLTMQEMTNFFRWLVGADPLKDPCVHSDNLQAGALVRNFEFGHQISDTSKPADMDESLWQQGANVSHNILALSYNPYEAIVAWMNEGYNTKTKEFNTFGHRDALIDKTVSSVQFGYAGSVSIGRDAARKNVNTACFTAFPSPGYVPSNFVYPTISGWQVIFDPTRVKAPDDHSGIKVTITNLNSGESIVRSEQDSTIKAGVNRINFAQPEDTGGTIFKDSYKVSISGLVDVPTGSDAIVEYIVNFTNITNDIRSYVHKAACEFDTLTIYKSRKDTTSLNKVAAMLPDYAVITAESGMKCTVPVSGKWALDKEAQCFRNSADASDLPSNLTDKNNLLADITIPYTITDREAAQYNTLAIHEENYEEEYEEVLEGSNAIFVMNGVYISDTTTSRIYRIVDNGDGTYCGEKKLDSDTAEGFVRNGNEDIFILKNVKMADAGEYAAVYYNPSFDDMAYVCVDFPVLNVVKERDPDAPEYYIDPSGIVDISSPDRIEVQNMTDKTYTGSALKQKKIEIFYGEEWLVKGDDYKLSYKDNVNVGTATMIIRGIGDYTGEVTRTFKINPGSTALKTLKKGKKCVTVKWKKQAVQTSGYEIQYSLKSNFKKSWTVQVADNTKTSQKIKKLKAKKKYYVKIRTYTTVDGKNYYSAWSAKKSVKTK